MSNESKESDSKGNEQWDDNETEGSDNELSSSSLSDSDLDDGGWGEPIQSFPCVAVGRTDSVELAEIANDGEESMDLFAVSWRSRVTPTTVCVLLLTELIIYV